MASKDTAIAAIMEQLMAEGPQAMAPVVTALMNLAMRMEREQFLGAGHYERSSGRRGYANGAKLKTQVSRAAALLDDELEAWRDRPLGCFRYLFLDARYEKTREQGVADDCAVLSAIGIEPSGKRRILGVSVAFSEAEVHWRAFLESLVARGLQGVEFITSDDHPGLKAARQAVLPGARWQRCQFHLAQNAIHHAPNQAIRKAIGEELRAVWDAPSLGSAEEELKRLVAKYRTPAPKLAAWLENSVPESLAVFKLPRDHRRTMRTSNPIERSIQQELKRRTRKIRVFPNEASLVRLASAILVEIDEQWAASQKPYVNFNNADAD